MRTPYGQGKWLYGELKSTFGGTLRSCTDFNVTKQIHPGLEVPHINGLQHSKLWWEESKLPWLSVL